MQDITIGTRNLFNLDQPGEITEFLTVLTESPGDGNTASEKISFRQSPDDGRSRTKFSGELTA